MSTRTLLAACALLCACVPDDGVALGRFRVVATRGGNTCGAQSMQLDPTVSYAVELKAANGVARWVPEGATTVAGTWNAPARAFRFVLEQDLVAWQPDPRRDIVGCTVHRTDVIEGTVTFDDPDAGDGSVDAGADAGAAPVARSFRATETIVFGPAPGSDCRPLVGAGDGQFTTMPCDVTYALSGSRM